MHVRTRSIAYAFWQEHGFTKVMRYPRSQLDVTDFDFTPFSGAKERAKRHGIEIWRLTELREADPKWQEKLWESEWEIDQDVPSPDPFTRQPIEEYVKRFTRPNFTADGWFIAVDSTQESRPYVGMSTIWPSSANKEKVYVGLTGTLRSHRRKGIATALKLLTFKFTQSIGARFIETDNEENNPMYDLNMKLGFEPLPAWVDFEKKLAAN